MSVHTTTSPSNGAVLTDTPEMSGSQSDCVVLTYLAESKGYVKIGRSRSPLDRLTRIAKWQAGEIRPIALRRTALTVLLVLPDDCERELHQRFREDRFVGEWFRLSPAITQYVTDNAHRDVWTQERVIQP